MLAYIRHMADRVKRREIAALVIVGVCGALGFAMGCTGGRAFLQQACSTFPKPSEEEQRWVDEIAIVAPLDEVPPLVPPPAAPPASRPAPVIDVFPVAPMATALVSSVSLRGPPRVV